jgi:hypothetical protein
MQSTRYRLLILFVLASSMTQPSPVSADSPRYLFGTPQLVEGISTPGVGEDSPSLSHDGLELFFASNSGDGNVPDELYVAYRDPKDSNFSSPVPLDSLNMDGPATQPNISSDGLTLYYVSDESLFGIWSATRPSRNEPFGNPSLLIAPEPGWGLVRPSVSSDGRSLYLQAFNFSRFDRTSTFRAARA